jgi:hypothetical protein
MTASARPVQDLRDQDLFDLFVLLDEAIVVGNA